MSILKFAGTVDIHSNDLVNFLINGAKVKALLTRDGNNPENIYLLSFLDHSFFSEVHTFKCVANINGVSECIAIVCLSRYSPDLYTGTIEYNTEAFSVIQGKKVLMSE